MAKILFIGQSTRHFSYYSSSLYYLSKYGHTFHFRYDEHFSNSKLSSSLNEFLELHPSEFKWQKKRNFIYQFYIFFFRELATYVWYLGRIDQSTYYVNRWAKLFPYPVSSILKQSVIKEFLKLKCIKNLIFYLSKKFYSNNDIKNDILSISPDVIYASPCNLRFSSEIDYIQQAKRLKIPVVYSILSWDNLTNKGLFHVVPDLFLVWNQNHKNELEKLHNITDIPIKIVGSQLFDKWLLSDPSLSISDEILNVSKYPYILYLGSSSNIIDDETEIMNVLLNELVLINPTIKIIFKPHPFHYEKYHHLNSDKLIVLSNKFGLSETTSDIVNFKYLIEKSLFVIGINTSGFLDSIIIGKPTFAYTNHSFSETQIKSAHYKVLRKYNVLNESNSLKKIFDSNFSTKDFDLYRNLFISQFVWPKKNKSAGEVAANEINNFLITSKNSNFN